MSYAGFDANAFEVHLSYLVQRAFHSFVLAETAKANAVQNVSTAENEQRRLVDLQLPMFFSVALTQEGVNRAAMLETAIGRARKRTSRIGGMGMAAIARRLEIDLAHVRLLTPERIEQFFRDARQWCRSPAIRAPGAAALLTELVVPIWDCIGCALTFQFQAEIGRSNTADGSLVLCWDNRVESCLEHQLGATTESLRRNAEASLENELELAISCLDVEQIWDFAVREVGTLVRLDSSDLVLPDRMAIANELFARARELFSIRARTNVKWSDEHDYIEIRTQGTLKTGEPALDEIVAQGACIHLEQMSPSSWFIGISAAGKRFHLSFELREGRLEATLSDQDDDGETWQGENREWEERLR